MKASNKLIALTLTAVTALTGGAAVWKATSFPSRHSADTATERKGIMRAPLNQERAKGLKVFGTTQIDYDRIRHFVNYYQNQYMLEKLQWISREDEPGISTIRNFHCIYAGAYNPDDGFYYAYKVKQYTFEYEAYQWLKVDPRTGEWSVITELPRDAHFNDYLYDMAYSVYDGEMFGLTQSNDGTVTSRIAVMDLADSSMKDYVQLKEYYFAMAFDYDGNLYAIRWRHNANGDIIGTNLDEFDGDFNVKKSTEIKVNGAEFLPYYQHGLDFNYTTGELVWAATDSDGNQKMVVIDPDTYETTDLGHVGYSENMIGLYVPYETATHREAPAKVDRLSVLRNRDGAETVTISWRNPTKTWNRKDLTDLSEVYVYRDSRDSEPVGKVDVKGKEGATARYVDNAPQGVHMYYIRAVNAKGIGVTDSIEGFSGHDVPGKVSNLAVETIDEGHGVRISWGLPETGDSEGWYDSNLTYTVTRMPGNVVVAKDIAETTFDDKEIKEAQFYTYTVVPKSADGEGTPSTSTGILAGASLVIPFETSFETADEAARFSSVDLFGVNNLYSYGYGPDGKTHSMHYTYNNTNDIALMSPPLSVEKGKKYHVSYTYILSRFGRSFEDYYNNFRIIAGDALNYESLTVVAADIKDQLTEKNHETFTVDGYFEAPADGEYYVGLQLLTEGKNNDAWIDVTNFRITPSPDNDLAVTRVDVPAFVSSSDDNYIDVTVYNNGSNPQSNYKVEAGVSQLNGTFVPFASTTDVPTIASHESATIRIKGRASVSGIQDVQAHVVLEGDGFADNDFSDYIEVEFYDGPAYNFHAADDDSEWEDTSYPFYLYTSNSMSQSIYPASMIAFDVENPEIAALAWEYRSERDIDDLDLEIYLGQTDKTYYPENSPRALKDQTLVFKGTLALKEGSNWLTAEFADKSFNADPSKNLVVTIICHETSANGEFPALFKVINSPQTGDRHCDGLNHSVRYFGNAPFDFGSSSVYSDKHMAKLHVALKTKESGVQEVDANGMNITVNGKTLYVEGDPCTIEVFDLSGRILCNLPVKGSTSVTLPVATGVYIVKAIKADGNEVTRKVVIR